MVINFGAVRVLDACRGRKMGPSRGLTAGNTAAFVQGMCF